MSVKKADPLVDQLQRRVTQLEQQLDRFRRSEQFLETSEANLHLFAQSLAHDLNNLIGGMLGHASLIQADTEPGSDLNDSATVILKAAERACELTQQLMNFTKGGLGRNVAVDVHEVIREVADLLRRTIDPEIRLTLELGARAATLSGDAGQIHQLLFNLALNARDAMPEGGQLVFATRDGEAAGMFEVIVRDTGAGIPAEVQVRIFEPFFTTKDSGKGTGMGLAIVKRVVQNHSGRIAVESTPGTGTCFRIGFPLLEAKEATPGLSAMAAAMGTRP